MIVTQTTQFRRDARKQRKQRKRGKDLRKIKDITDLLIAGESLPERLRDHALAGNWRGWRDCHIEPDWLLIYKLLADELILGRTGNHSDLF